MNGAGRDFEDLLKETELDSAKMILRLTSELREKELEVASTRSRAFDEVQRNNKAREEEYEALMRAQEDRIAKREQSLARLLVEKESALWQKYQAMLDEAVGRQREDFEAQRALLKAGIEKKETELAAQKKNLRLEMEALFHKWEEEREADFKIERETFIEELKLGRATAQKEALERARQMEELWRQKLSQQETEYESREAMAAEEVRSQMRRERVEELKTLNDRLNAEFSKREQELYAHYASWLEENKKLLEDKFSRRLEASQAEYRERTAALEEALAKTREELANRGKDWEEKYSGLKASYSEKEAALEKAARELQARHLERERELAEKQETLAGELREEAARRKDALARKEKDLERNFESNLADFTAEAERRLRAVEERETKTAAERQELAALRAQIGALLTQKQTELEKTFEERNSLLRQSLVESFKIKEISLDKKYEDLKHQQAELASQKDAAMSRAKALMDENKRLKDALVSRDSKTHGVIEAERARLEEERARLEAELQAKEERLKAAAHEQERALKAAYAQRAQADSGRLAAQLAIKEAAVEKEREALNRRAAELEAGFLETLRAREAEVTENFKRNTETLKAQAAAARRGWEEERAARAAQAEAMAAGARAEEQEKAARRETDLKAFYENRERELLAAARDSAAGEAKRLEDALRLKERTLAARVKALEDSLAKALADNSGASGALSAARGELELLTARLDDSERERQKLIQENLTKSRDLRQTLEKEFLDKLREIEQNYLGQITALSKRSDETRKADRDEYFRKLQFVKDDFEARLASQAKDMEASYLERERKITAAQNEAYKVKERALVARQAQLESSYQAMLSEKSERVDVDRSLADDVTRLKTELEHNNSQLRDTIASYNTRLEELETKLRGEFEARKKELEDGQRIRALQLEAERNKLKTVLDQEQQLVGDLQKREAALQENYAAREADLARRFKEARERLEKDYQNKLKGPG
ncbi:MAG TPA: hypothetical protein DCS63_10205 [Elusimicrobia bacterium]|nr:hypothetical protein [Elusimicrobiota bacterium]